MKLSAWIKDEAWASIFPAWEQNGFLFTFAIFPRTFDACSLASRHGTGNAQDRQHEGLKTYDKGLKAVQASNNDKQVQQRQASSTLQCCSPGCCCPDHGGTHKRSCCKGSPYHQGTRNGRHKQRRQASSTLQCCRSGCSYHHHGGTHKRSC